MGRLGLQTTMVGLLQMACHGLGLGSPGGLRGRGTAVAVPHAHRRRGMKRQTQGVGLALLLVVAGLVAPRVPHAAAQEAVVVGRITHTEARSSGLCQRPRTGSPQSRTRRLA